MRHITILVIGIWTLGVGPSGCELGPPPGESPEEAEKHAVETLEAPLYGSLSFGANSCSGPHQTLLRNSWRIGKIAGQTDAFEQCLATRVASDYVDCGWDHTPTFGAALYAARSQNSVEVTCANLPDEVAGFASGALNHLFDSPYHNDTEEFLISRLTLDRAAAYHSAGQDGTSGIAGIIWHEVMHTHSFQDIPYCWNDTSATGYDISTNAMTYIVGSCIRETAASLIETPFIAETGRQPTWEEERDYRERIHDGSISSPHQLSQEIRKQRHDHRRWVGNFDSHTAGDEIALWREGWNSIPVYRFLGNFWGFYTFNFYQPSGWMNESGGERYQGDFNGDGVNDFVVLKGSSQIQTYFGNGQGGFSFTNRYLPSYAQNLSGTRNLVGDFDGDGDSDILRWNPDRSSITVLISHGNGWFHAAYTWLNSNNGWINDPTTVKLVGNFDGQHGQDIALARPGWGSTPVYFSNGDGTFQVTNEPTLDNRINRADQLRFTGDFDGDGKTDIATIQRTTPGPEALSAQPGGLGVYFSNGNGSFTRTAGGFSNIDHSVTVSNPSLVLYNRTRGRRIHVADFDGNGRDDIFVGPIGGDASAGVHPDHFVVFYSEHWDSTNLSHCGSYPGTGGHCGWFEPVLSSLHWWETYTADWISRPDVHLLFGAFSGQSNPSSPDSQRTDILLWREGWATTPVYAAWPQVGHFSVRNNSQTHGGTFNVLNQN